MSGSFFPYVAECLAFQEGLEFVTACGLQIFVVETDALAVSLGCVFFGHF